MRHRNHRHTLGVKKEHRAALMSNLAAGLFLHGRIRTTLAKAKALRPFAERIITLAKQADATEDRARKLHFRRLALSRVRDRAAVRALFDERAPEFANRTGGYIRIYKIGFRASDATEMTLVELIDAADEGYSSRRKGSKAKKAESSAKPAAEEQVEVEDVEAKGEAVEAVEPAAEGDAPEPTKS